MTLSDTLTIHQIISISDKPVNQIIHKIFDRSEGWCYITYKNGQRIKLINGMKIEDVENHIRLAHFYNKK